MKSPIIKVIERDIKDCQFKVYALEYPDGTYSDDFGKDREHTEKTIYEGPIPREMRILPFVPDEYLENYMNFRSQKVPLKILKNTVMFAVAKAIRGECHNMYDQETYGIDGRISSSMSPMKDDIRKYLRSLLTEEDLARMKKYQKEVLEWDEDEDE